MGNKQGEINMDNTVKVAELVAMLDKTRFTLEMIRLGINTGVERDKLLESIDFTLYKLNMLLNSK